MSYKLNIFFLIEIKKRIDVWWAIFILIIRLIKTNNTNSINSVTSKNSPLYYSNWRFYYSRPLPWKNPGFATESVLIFVMAFVRRLYSPRGFMRRIICIYILSKIRNLSNIQLKLQQLNKVLFYKRAILKCNERLLGCKTWHKLLGNGLYHSE